MSKTAQEEQQQEKPLENREEEQEEDDDDEGDNTGGKKEVKVDNFKFAEDDITQEVPYPAKSMLALPRHLAKLVDSASNLNNNNNDNGDGAATAASAEKKNPLRIFKAPHPRHGEAVFYLGATYTVEDKATGELSLLLDGDDNNKNSSTVACVKLYEIQSRRPPHSTWFVGNEVEPQSPLYIVTPMHPAFIALRMAALDAVTQLGGREAFEALLAATPGKDEETNSTKTQQQGGETTSLRFRGADDWTERAQQMFFSDAKDMASSNSTTSNNSRLPDLWTGYLQEGFETVCETREHEGSGSFYRFSPERTRDWLQRRFARLARSAAMDRLVFGSAGAAGAAASAAASATPQLPGTEQQQQQSAAAAAVDKNTQAILEERSLGLLSEYIPNVFPAIHIRRWVLGEQRAANNILTAKAAPSAFAAHQMHQLTDDFGGGGGAAGDLKKRKVEETAKSASVKRLEKAGAPKGTPSVASFFKPKPKQG